MKTNPVLNRIKILTRSWEQFTDNINARILRWCLQTDAARMLDAFVAWHGEEQSELDDIFIVMPVPFEDRSRFAHGLVQHLADEFESANGDLESMELPFAWKPAIDLEGEVSVQDFIATASSLAMHYEGVMPHVGLVLMPPKIYDRDEWLLWLEELARVSYWPSNVRLLVVDWLPDTRLNGWANDYSDRVVSKSPVLDMDGLPLEILSQLPGSGPGFDFRRLFVLLGSAACVGNVTLVKDLANQALAITNVQGWMPLGATVQMMVAATLQTSGQHEESLSTYRKAREIAMQASSSDPARAKTIVTSNLALSSSLVGQGKFDEARKCYYEAAKLADETGDSFAAFESRRMASYCSEQVGDYTSALRDGQQALQQLESRSIDERLQSTAPQLAMRLADMAKRPELIKHARDIQRFCEQTLSGDWRSVAQAALNA